MIKEKDKKAWRLRDLQNDLVILREPLALADALKFICPGFHCNVIGWKSWIRCVGLQTQQLHDDDGDWAALPDQRKEQSLSLVKLEMQSASFTSAMKREVSQSHAGRSCRTWAPEETAEFYMVLPVSRNACLKPSSP